MAGSPGGNLAVEGNTRGGADEVGVRRPMASARCGRWLGRLPDYGQGEAGAGERRWRAVGTGNRVLQQLRSCELQGVREGRSKLSDGSEAAYKTLRAHVVT